MLNRLQNFQYVEDVAYLSKCRRGCELSMLQMLQCFPGVAGLQCLQNVAMLRKP